MTIKKKRLFRLTTKRKKMFENIINTLNRKIEAKEEGGLEWVYIMNDEKLSGEEKKLQYVKLDIERKKLYLYHDVLETVICHTKRRNHNFFMREERNWKNEWEIPLPVFNESIEAIIDILEWYKKRASGKYLTSYDEKIAFLNRLKDYRNQ